MHDTISKLKKGETIEFEGLKLRKAQGELQRGDVYVAERNTGPKLLTVKKIVEDEYGPFYVLSVEFAYPYDYCECVKVEIVE